MARKQKTDPRAMMELAIEVMRLSIAEHRPDGKPNPKVGAVIVRKDGSVDTAFRGELREGDHAEFTLLERKNRHLALDGAVLYATLEPCAPGARKHPKLGCAERIVLARIKEVYVGITDPDPTVDRKGIQYLLDNGVKVGMFDRDLQEVIRKANTAFIDQAEARAVSAKEEKTKEVVLSPLEKKVAAVNTKDLSAQALAGYRTALFQGKRNKTEDFNRMLVQQGVLLEERDQLLPSGFGALLFGTRPRSVLQQAGLLGTIRYPNGKEETRDFDGPLIDIPGEVETWLRNKLPNLLERDRMKAREVDALPFVLVREAVVNALVHRDYSIKGAKCQLLLDTDSVVVKSPGKPIDPITMEQMRSFEAPMLSRNPLLHYVFRKMGLAEERGLGLDALKERSHQLGLPLPKFVWKDPYLELTLFLTAKSARRAVAKDRLDELSTTELAGLDFLATRKEVGPSAYAEHLGLDIRQAQRHMRHFIELGLVRAMGQTKNRRYALVR